MNKQPWIGKPWIDILFILSPPFISLLVIILFPSLFQDNSEMPVASWVVLVLLVDVAHVYSTLYRTYFDPYALREQRFLLWTIPFVSFVAGTLLYAINDHLFWRLLAYVAVFHFVRQQYGFMRVYSRKEPWKKWPSFIDKLTIYSATVYPLLYWHFSGPRNFNWFIEEDFFYMPSIVFIEITKWMYLAIVAVFFLKEIILLIRNRSFNIPKFSIITGTLLSWYFGIVYFNGDMAFTLLNVVSHGIPYMALVWAYGKKRYRQPGQGTRFLSLVFSRYGVVLFLGVIVGFAFIEEGLWDLAVWKEHGTVFGLRQTGQLKLNDALLSLVVPLLALPQITHYVLDGFIWKIRQEEFKWNNEVTAHKE